MLAREVPISAAEELSTKSSFSICCIKLEQTILSFFFIYVLYIDVIEFITGPRPTYSLEMFFPAAYKWNVNCYSAIQQLQLCTPPQRFQRRFFYFLRNDKIFFIWDRVQRKRLYLEVNIFALRLVNNVIIALCVAKQYPFLSFPSDLNKLIVNTNHKQIELHMPVCKFCFQALKSIVIIVIILVYPLCVSGPFLK